MKKEILYLDFSKLNKNELIHYIFDSVEQKKMNFFVAVNLDLLRGSYKNLEFRKAINSASLCVVDGKPISWLSHLFHYGHFDKISGSDFVYPVLEKAKETQTKILIIGGKEQVGQMAMEKVNESFGTQVVIDYISPVFGFEKSKDLTDQLIEEINSKEFDIALLCLGAPKQEMFYYQNKEKLKPAFYMCMGATVDFLAGNIKRAPKWMSKIGLEWLYRLAKEPKRLFKRYFLDFFFLIKIIFVRIFNKKKIIKKREESL